MRIASLRLKNVGPFRGEHLLELGPLVYAVVARTVLDPERSNWLGKTTLLETVELVLYGDHRYRTDDEWISHGEKFGEAEITFDDGSRAVRSRERAKRGTLIYVPSAGAAALMKDEAQEEIVRRVGLTKQDSIATWNFKQKAMSRFVTSDPADRMKMVSGWLRLGPLEKAEKRTRELGSGLEASLKEIAMLMASMDAREAEIARKDAAGNPVWTREAIEKAIPMFVEDLERRSGVVAGLQDELEKNASVLAGRDRAKEYEQVIAEGLGEKKRLEGLQLPVLQERFSAARAKSLEASASYGAAQRDESAKASAARGEFSGKCPVAGIACPATAEINAQNERSRSIADEAAKKLREARLAFETVNAEEQALGAEIQAANRIAQRLTMLREQAGKLWEAAKAAKDAGEPKDPAMLRARLDKERGDQLDVRAEIERLKGWLAELDRMAATRKTLLAKRAEVEAEIGTYRELAVIFGKQGAQRKVAEGALATIEEDANDVLRETGADLRVEVRWARETQGLAKACERCGWPFPASAKVRSCERCGAERGQQLESKLEIALSDRSGAAEDLAGAAVQLAASRWLRDDRGTAWSTALLDEPFGALDAAHRKGLASHLAAMLSGRYGFEQALVVAHHSSVLDALPGRIEIVRDGKWSVPRVVT